MNSDVTSILLVELLIREATTQTSRDVICTQRRDVTDCLISEQIGFVLTSKTSDAHKRKIQSPPFIRHCLWWRHFVKFSQKNSFACDVLMLLRVAYFTLERGDFSQITGAKNWVKLVSKMYYTVKSRKTSSFQVWWNLLEAQQGEANWDVTGQISARGNNEALKKGNNCVSSCTFSSSVSHEAIVKKKMSKNGQKFYRLKWNVNSWATQSHETKFTRFSKCLPSGRESV